MAIDSIEFEWKYETTQRAHPQHRGRFLNVWTRFLLKKGLNADWVEKDDKFWSASAVIQSFTQVWDRIHPWLRMLLDVIFCILHVTSNVLDWPFTFVTFAGMLLATWRRTRRVFRTGGWVDLFIFRCHVNMTCDMWHGKWVDLSIFRCLMTLTCDMWHGTWEEGGFVHL